MSKGMAIVGAFAGATMALYGLWRILKAARRGETVLRGHKVYRNADPRDFWMTTLGDVVLLVVGVALTIHRLGKLS
jgi:prolipoprotein diacylglyceryltransferase